MHYSNSRLWLALLLMAAMPLCKAQRYHPFPAAHTIWGEAFSAHEDSSFRIVYYGLKNQDTVINALTYHKLYRSADTVFQEAEYFGGLRDDTAARKVYFYGTIYGNTPAETLLFDFSLNQGDTLKANANGGKNNWYINSNSLVVSNVDSVLIDGIYRKRLYLGFPVPSVWVEGIGNIVRGLFFYPGTYPNNGTWNELVCMQQHNDWFYHLSSSWIYPPHTYPACVDLLLNNVPAQGIEKTAPLSTGVRFYPNPVNGISRMVIREAGKYQLLELYSAAGSKVYAASLDGRTEVAFNRQDFVPGLYVYRLSGKDGTCLSGRFIVE